MMKNVNGVNVKMTNSEIAEFEASRSPVTVTTGYSIPKLTVVQRLTDEEAETVYPAMSAMPAKLRLVWDTASEIRTDSEFFDNLKEFLDALLPAGRSDELLAPEA